ncbi:hypothetical protein BC629DRAFT_1651867 [Irpex lacteus]|nr:hypothetical protein BC629DRAFT_1651867 [Irpex lacteus]
MPQSKPARHPLLAINLSPRSPSSVLVPSRPRQSEHTGPRTMTVEGMIPSPPPTVLFEVESAIRTTAKPPLLAPTSTSIRRFHVEYEVPGVVPIGSNNTPLRFGTSTSASGRTADPSLLTIVSVPYSWYLSAVSPPLCGPTVHVTLYTRLRVSQFLATSPDFHIKPEVSGGSSTSIAAHLDPFLLPSATRSSALRTTTKSSLLDVWLCPPVRLPATAPRPPTVAAPPLTPATHPMASALVLLHPWVKV